jgi:hypothetical protein
MPGVCDDKISGIKISILQERKNRLRTDFFFDFFLINVIQ